MPTLALPAGPPTAEDIAKIRAKWYGRRNNYVVVGPNDFIVVEWEEGAKYGCVVYRRSDSTYWYIRDVFQVYSRWLGPVIPVEVEPKEVVKVVYVRKY